MEPLECHSLLQMKLLLDVAENLKHHKKKKLDEEAVVDDASMLLGLSDGVISDALKNLAKADILDLRDNACINYKNKMDLSRCLVVKFMEKTPETLRDSLDSKHQQPHAPSITTTPPDTSAVSKDIYSSFPHLASSFVEVQKVIEQEREINRCLLIENAKFISQLGDSVVMAESPSRRKSHSNPDNEAIENKQTPIVLEDIRSKTTIENAANRARTNRKGKSKKKASNSLKKEISTSLDSTNDREIANETVNSSTSASISRKSKQSANDKEYIDNDNIESSQKTAKKTPSVESNSQEESKANRCATSQPQSLTSSTNNQGAWPKNTVLIAGDCMLLNIHESTLSRRYHTKVRCFKGSTIADLHDYLKPLIKKKPAKIILMVGTNDLANLSAAEMTKSIKALCDWILSSIPDCNIIVSEIVRREDKMFLNGKISEFNRALKAMNLDILRQQNITSTHLGKKGLHLNFQGIRQLAKNIIEKLRTISL